jgi:hypothetical protein
MKSGTGAGDAIVGTKRKPAPLLAICASVFKKPVVVSFQFNADPLGSSYGAFYGRPGSILVRSIRVFLVASSPKAKNGPPYIRAGRIKASV